MTLSKENAEQIFLDVIMLSSKILNIFFSFLSEQKKVLYLEYSNLEFKKEFREYNDIYVYYFDIGMLSFEESIPHNFHINLELLKEWENSLSLYSSKIENIDIKKDIFLSLIHMLCNRIFGIQSEQEKKLFNIINRIVLQKIAIQKYNQIKLKESVK